MDVLDTHVRKNRRDDPRNERLLEPMDRCVFCNIRNAGVTTEVQDRLRSIAADANTPDFSFMIVYVGKGHAIRHSNDIDHDELKGIYDA